MLFWILFLSAFTGSCVSYSSTNGRAYQRHIAVWSEWSSWTPCSKSCGTGVSTRSRKCYYPSLLRHSKLKYGSCNGSSTMAKVCNMKVCPNGEHNFITQCAKYNNQLLGGRRYSWRPFYIAGEECVLNCRASHHRFYARLKPKLEDGTHCGKGKVCYGGRCLKIDCNGVISEDGLLHRCGQEPHRVAKGLFMRPILPHYGYNTITEIPKFACNVTISQIQFTPNFLAIREKYGDYILNGLGSADKSDSYRGAGTIFQYVRDEKNKIEQITSSGPLQETVEVMMNYRKVNLGIKYEYYFPLQLSLNETIAPPTLSVISSNTSVRADEPIDYGDNLIPNGRRSIKPILNFAIEPPEDIEVPKNETCKKQHRDKSRKFSWSVSGFTECSKSCAGGTQTAVLVCKKLGKDTVVLDKRCSTLPKPLIKKRACNTQPCLPEWTLSNWSACSVTCGEGVETRDISCERQMSSTVTTTVTASLCPFPQPVTVRKCYEDPCQESDNPWHTGPWSQCSVDCGFGVRTRSVYCPSGSCPLRLRPSNTKDCEGPCSVMPTNVWIYSDWSNQCSENCGKGIQTRRVVCYSGTCDEKNEPERSRSCLSEKLCSGQWFTGPWQRCTGTCNDGEQTRTIFCISTTGGVSTIVSESNCDLTEKPLFRQKCSLPACRSQWFSTEWSYCSKSCGSGFQSRHTVCLDEHNREINTCDARSKPDSHQPCNEYDCFPSDQNLLDAVQYQTESASQTENIPKGQTCVDKLSNCHIALQARLCSYKYYNEFCCNSCQKWKRNYYI